MLTDFTLRYVTLRYKWSSDTSYKWESTHGYKRLVGNVHILIRLSARVVDVWCVCRCQEIVACNYFDYLDLFCGRVNIWYHIVINRLCSYCNYELFYCQARRSVLWDNHVRFRQMFGASQLQIQYCTIILFIEWTVVRQIDKIKCSYDGNQ